MHPSWFIKDRKIRVGLVGCGRIAESHLKAIQAHHDDLELVSLCDNNPDALKTTAANYAVDTYSSLEDMLTYSNCDVVTICTPSGLHPKQAIVTAKAGKHIITEKPMATRWNDALDMVKAADDANVRLFVVKQNRLNPPIQALKKAIDSGRFGKLYMASANVFWTRPQAYYDHASWRGTWEWDGGAFMNQASHYVDLVQWLLGPIDSVQAMTATLARHIEAEDSGVVAIRFKNHALASINVTMLTYPKNLEGSITILGEKGSVKIGGIAVNEIQHWEFEDSRPEDNDIQQNSYEINSVYGVGHPLYYQNVVEAFRGNASPLVDGREGLKSLGLLSGIYRSARDKVPVYFPLDGLL